MRIQNVRQNTRFHLGTPYIVDLFQYKCDTSNLHNLRVLILNMLLVFRLIVIQGHSRSSQGRTFPKFCFFFTHCILSPFEIVFNEKKTSNKCLN